MGLSYTAFIAGVGQGLFRAAWFSDDRGNKYWHKATADAMVAKRQN